MLVSIKIQGVELIKDSYISISKGNKYGLIGKNGVGKSTLLEYINKNNVNNPEITDKLYVTQDTISSDKPVYQEILESNKIRTSLLQEYNELNDYIQNKENDITDEHLDKYNELSNKLIEIDAYKDESIVMKILNGLQFTDADKNTSVNNFSGGWRMKISLARALYLKPSLLLLDEPTNHLDINSTIWLTNYIKNYKNTVILVSHNIELLNSVCTNMILIDNNILYNYKGNYDKYLISHSLELKSMEKEIKIINNKIREMRKKSKPKNEITEYINGRITKMPKPYKVNIIFNDVKDLKYPILDLEKISFSYNLNPIKNIIKNTSLSIDLKSRYAIVGENGSGKSTLLKILAGILSPISGELNKNYKLRVGYYHQHASDILPEDITPIEYIHKLKTELKLQDVRRLLGDIGLYGKLHNNKIKTLSGGQKARILIVSMYIQDPHIMLLDEPTNHMDITTNEALIKSINNYKGGVVMISHDINLIRNINCEILELIDGKIEKTTIDDYEYKILDLYE